MAKDASARKKSGKPPSPTSLVDERPAWTPMTRATDGYHQAAATRGRSEWPERVAPRPASRRGRATISLNPPRGGALDGFAVIGTPPTGRTAST